jgi:hypothetical protein
MIMRLILLAVVSIPLQILHAQQDTTWKEPSNFPHTYNFKMDVSGNKILTEHSSMLEPILGGEPFSYVEFPPTFKGGEEALYQYIGEHITYPAIAREKGIQGSVVVKFVVDVDSVLKRVHLVQKIGGGCDEEVLRLAGLMAEQKMWIPGLHNNRPIPVWYSLPVKFKLQGNISKDRKAKGQ